MPERFISWDWQEVYGMYRRMGKRVLDVFLSATALVLCSWLLLILAVLVWFSVGSPILFRVTRPGMREKLFVMIKFRTMTNQVDQNGIMLPDEQRLTKMGRFLRATSLDELPELWNVLKGDMSLVGPRPLSVKYLPYYSSEERLRHSVRPGILGLAQVNGRNSLSWERKFEYDLQYVQDLSLRRDIMIVVKGMSVVLGRKNVGQGEDQPPSLDDMRAGLDSNGDNASGEARNSDV